MENPQENNELELVAHEPPTPQEHNEPETPQEHNEPATHQEHNEPAPPQGHNEPATSHERNEPAATPQEHNEPATPQEHNEPATPQEHNEPTTPQEHNELAATPQEHNEPATHQEHNEPATDQEHNNPATHQEHNEPATPQEHNELAATPREHNELATPHEHNELSTPQEHNELAILQEHNDLASPETQPNKRRKKKSVVWEYFTIETISPECRRASCKQCKQSFAYSTGSKVAGTSHLKRHIAKGTCLAPLRNQGIPFTPGANGGASYTPKRRYRSPSSPYISFDSDRCRHEIARMIIMHDYPLHIVEHTGFVTFVQNLQPRFGLVSFNTVQGDCVATYLKEKQNIMNFVEGMPGRVCLTLDVWTSNQSLAYVFITGHFIDSDWKPQRRILNVVMEPYPDSDTALSHAVACCLSDWSLEGKLFSVTFNHPVGEPGLENLKSLLCLKNPLILNGQLLIGSCITHTLSCIALDVFSAGQDVIKKIRDSVKYVKTSDSYVEKFIELKKQLQVPSEKRLSLDNQTQWNTTYHMLVAASELKEVFSCLDTSDPNYKESPSMEQWRQAETLCTFLKPLIDAASVLNSTSSPVAITLFHEVWKIHTELGRAVANEDPFISSLAKGMHEKISKYWKDCSLVLAVAVIMDPRFKMKLVEFSFSKLYGDDAPTYIKIVDDGIHELFHEYMALPLPLTPAYAEEGNAENMKSDEHRGSLLSDQGLTDFDMYIMETTGQHMKSELDQYLDESLLPRQQELDVLGWWKLNKLKYPTLAKMARDILTIPVSAAAPDSVFDTVPKVLDEYRSSLRPETVEALVCAKDWLQYGPAEDSNMLVKMEH